MTPVAVFKRFGIIFFVDISFFCNSAFFSFKIFDRKWWLKPYFLVYMKALCGPKNCPTDQLLQIFNFYMTEERPFFQNCSSLTRNDCFMAKRILPMLVKILTLVAHCWFKSENKKCPGIRIWANFFFHEICLTGNDTSLKPDIYTVTNNASRFISD